MSNVANSAAHSATQLFGTITTTANALSTAVNVVGNGFDVLNVKSQDWLNDTRIKSAAMAEEREIAIIDDITISIATRLMERTQLLEANPKLAVAYNASLARVTAAVKLAKERHGIATVPVTQAPAQAAA